MTLIHLLLIGMILWLGGLFLLAIERPLSGMLGILVGTGLGVVGLIGSLL